MLSNFSIFNYTIDVCRSTIDVCSSKCSAK